jgi:large subunit ribosomal protein L10e
MKSRPFTRISRNKSKSYIKTVPAHKVVKFHLGNQKEYRAGNHAYGVGLFAEGTVQIRDTAIEAARQMLVKIMDEQAAGQYYMGVRIFPHHFLRENKTAAGVGADRMSTGMTHSYGIIIGRVARVPAGKLLFLITTVTQDQARIARDALSQVRPKLPGKTRVVFQKLG